MDKVDGELGLVLTQLHEVTTKSSEAACLKKKVLNWKYGPCSKQDTREHCHDACA